MGRRRADLRRGRAWALLTLVLFVLGEGLSLGHRALERHAVCEEHGELTHLGDHAHAPAELTRPALGEVDASAPSGAAAFRVPEEGESDPHGDHCDLGFRRVGQRVGLRPIVGLATLVAPAVGARPPSSRPLVSQQRWLFAPKQSPPVAG